MNDEDIRMTEVEIPLSRCFYPTLVDGKFKFLSNLFEQKSKLTPEALAVNGFTGDCIRHLLNNLGNICTSYLEVGVHYGATFVSANFGNKMKVVAIDDWTGVGLNHDGMEVRDAFFKNVKDHLPGQEVKLIDQDCFMVTELPQPVDFYFYDGNHREDSQYKSLTHFYPMLAEEFIFCVDDWDWNDSKTGTRRAIADLDLEVVEEWEFTTNNSSDPKTWWNGFYVGLFSK